MRLIGITLNVICQNLNELNIYIKRNSLKIPGNVGDQLLKYFLDNSLPQTNDNICFFTSEDILYKELYFKNKIFFCRQFFQNISPENLSYLDLTDCNLDYHVSKKISLSLKKSRIIQTIILNDNKNLCPDGLRIICDSLYGSVKSLNHLGFSKCHLNENNCIVIGKLLSKCHSIISIDLSSNEEIGEGIIEICSSLIHSKLSLKKLSLSFCKIKDTYCFKIGEYLKNFSNLEYFNFEGNKNLKENLPEIFKGLSFSTFMKELNFRSCIDSTVNLKNIDTFLYKFKKLEIIDISRNNFQDIECFIVGLKNSAGTLKRYPFHTYHLSEQIMPKLLDFTESCSSLETISLESFPSEQMGQFYQAFHTKSLKALYISNNILSEENSRKLNNSLSHTFLTIFKISNTKNFNKFSSLLFDGLEKSSKTLRILNLEFCNITIKTCKNLASFLRNCCYLESLDVGGNTKMQDGLSDLFDSLKTSSKKLCSLNFQCIDLKPTYYDNLLELLQNCCNLKRINLSDISYSDDCFPIILDRLVQSAKNLQTLFIRSNRCLALNISSVIKSLSSLKDLKSINLQGSDCNIKADYVYEFPSNKCFYLKLTEIELSRCRLSPSHGQLLGKFLKNCPKLEYINVCQNENLGNGITAIFEGLISSFSSLKTIGFQNCGTKSEDCEIVEKVLKKCTNLTNFNCSQNYFIEGGIVNICDGLKISRNSLIMLSLHNCGLKEEFNRNIMDLLQACTNLKHVMLHGNVPYSSNYDDLLKNTKLSNNSHENLFLKPDCSQRKN